MSLQKQDIINKKQVNQNNTNTLLKSEKKFKARNNKEYKVKLIVNSVVYDKKVEN